MRAIAISVALFLLIAIQGCASVVAPQIDRDKVNAERLAQSLSCGMSTGAVNKVLDGKLEQMSGPSEDLTHIYRLQFASVWFVFKGDRLLFSRVYVVDGLTSLKPQPRIDYCKS